MMESIEKLREFIGDQFVSSGQAYLQGMAIAGSIEREVAERYMLLPVDAEGVPIRVGDVMEYENPNDDDKPFTVLGVNNDGDVFHCLEDKRLVPTCISFANCLHHVKPRTLTDVLCDLFERKMTVTDAEQELRELMEVDA